MVNVGSRGLGALLVGGAVFGTALACSERDAAPNRDVHIAESSPADRAPADPRDTPGDDPPSGAKSAPALRDAGPAGKPDPTGSGRSGEFHLDGADIEYEAARRDPRPQKGRPIELVLRSTPPGAIAAIDGIPIGPTPNIWQGSTDGKPREFTFVLPGYAIARYRFIPMQSGVVHGTLGRLKSEPDAGPVIPAGR
jgi:hypothetical protein